MKKILEEGLNTDQTAIGSEEGLTAVQKLLFIRLLQGQGLFPKKSENGNSVSELRAIAKLTGLNYENQIKGGNAANEKVNQLIDEQKRKRITTGQLQGKLEDLRAVEELAELMQLECVINVIKSYRDDLTKPN